MADNVKLLVVDDNPMVLGMLQQSFSSLARVTTATDAADALLKAVDDAPDLLVCDYRMPGMDGRQLVEKLKSRPATANLTCGGVEQPSRYREFVDSAHGQQG